METKSKRKKEEKKISKRASCRRSYWRNRKKRIADVQKHQKATNYKSEKTKKARKLRYIKRWTRLKHPLKSHFCEFCGDKATEHHHNSNPIKVDRFNFVCHDCHVSVHNPVREHRALQGRIKNNGRK